MSDELQALDELLAIEVMGWHKQPRVHYPDWLDTDEEYVGFRVAGRPFAGPVSPRWSPTRNREQAMMVAEELLADMHGDINIYLMWRGELVYACYCWPAGSVEVVGGKTYDSLPLAICRAIETALKAEKGDETCDRLPAV